MPIQLTEEDITRFQTLYKKRFGKEMSRERAREEATQLLRLMELIYRPMTKEGYQKLQEHCRKRSGSSE